MKRSLLLALFAIVDCSASSTITMPIEVMGPNGSSTTVQFSVPSNINLSGSQTFWIQAHGVKYSGEASVQINSCAPIQLSNSTVTFDGLGGFFGGIGGGYSTLGMTMPLPAGCLVAGTNSVTFNFIASDGVTSGFRVLAFQGFANGVALISQSTFVQDDPTKWTPPFSDATNIAAGKQLFQTAALTSPMAINARCGDCHTKDGRDLQYFNYSNNAIITRAMFHGLTKQQGQQIASYIRSLASVPQCANARPWNPPYQPGPGMDAQPVTCWAAGAGLGAVLAADSQMQPYVMPSGSTAGWAANQYLNPREIPIVMQFPDWNGWLPRTHPLDVPGSVWTFQGSQLQTMYQQLSQAFSNAGCAPLEAGVPSSSCQSAYYDGNGYNMNAWQVYQDNLDSAYINSQMSGGWTATSRGYVYSLGQWHQVKFFELEQEFGLEQMPQIAYPNGKANPRGWFGPQPFLTSPNMLHISPGPGLGNGSVTTQEYLAQIWYHLQLVLNDGQGAQQGSSPIDFPYVFGFLKDLDQQSGQSVPNIWLQVEWLVKALQAETLTGIDPSHGSQGWQPHYSIPELMVDSAWAPIWSATSATLRTQIMHDYLQYWFDQASQYTAAQYYAGGWASPSENPETDDYQVTFGGALWYLLPRFRYYGVDPRLTYQIAKWAATIFPAGDWQLNNSLSCNAQGQCTPLRHKPLSGVPRK